MFLVCVLCPRQDPLPAWQGHRGPERESALSKVTQLGKGKGGTRTHVVLCPSERASGSLPAIDVWESLLPGSQSSRFPKPQFLHLEMAALTNLCLSTGVSDPETLSPSSFQWFCNPGYTQPTFSPPCGKGWWDLPTVLARAAWGAVL